MNFYVFDTNAVIAYLNDENGASRVDDILIERDLGLVRAFLSPVSLGEIHYIIARKSGEHFATHSIECIRDFRMEIPPVGAHMALRASALKHKYGLHYADTFPAALAQEYEATLLTRDKDFKAVSHLIKVEWI